jgi:hypothetical protein
VLKKGTWEIAETAVLGLALSAFVVCAFQYRSGAEGVSQLGLLVAFLGSWAVFFAGLYTTRSLKW